MKQSKVLFRLKLLVLTLDVISEFKSISITSCYEVVYVNYLQFLPFVACSGGVWVHVLPDHVLLRKIQMSSRSCDGVRHVLDVVLFCCVSLKLQYLTFF